MARIRTRLGRALLLPLLLAACGDDHAASQPVVHYQSDRARLTIEFATDDLVHFEFAAGAGAPDAAAPIVTTPMVATTEHPGPTRFSDNGRGTLSTATLRLVIDPTSLCITISDLRHAPGPPLTTLCPDDTSLTLTAESADHLYGLGEHFLAPDQPNGDLLGHVIAPGNEVGNAVTAFAGGNTGNAQFPVLYAHGGSGASYALFLDQPQAQTWDLTGNPWHVTSGSDGWRGYVIGGRDLLDVRRHYMDLVGHPPVPPKKMFGLWVSEFGYDNWGELEDKLRTLRAGGFPVDGFVLDLQWFGGVFRRPSRIGALTFDPTNFPDPAAEIARLRDNGVGLMPIEEPYVDRSQPAYDDLDSRGYLTQACDGCAPADFTTWWGHGGMLDWTSAAAGDYWHDRKRQPLVELGVLGHWTDLGEPEDYSPTARYAGFPALGLFGESDVHNLYNLEWAASIQRGYARHGVPARPFILSRSGTAGLARFGAAMWSGDIGSNMHSLAAQLDVQMHMSFSGIDYFGSDVGGYFHGAPDGDADDLYTEWFADSAMTDVPLRPHTENLCNCRETAPDRIGDPASNLAHLRLRYRLLPYFYSLAHRAYRFGEPLVAPLVMYFPDDPQVRPIADEKLLGADLLVATTSTYGQVARDVYLPAGTWVDFNTDEWIDSRGEWLAGVLLRGPGFLRLPLYARAGAIIPQMYVDELTMNVLGQRLDGSTRDELVVRVFADARPTHFTLYEDDGATVAYQHDAVRTTEIAQQRSGDSIHVVIGPASGDYDGAPSQRDNVVELVARNPPDGGPRAVTLNGVQLAAVATPSEFDQSAAAVWYLRPDHVLLIRSGRMAVGARKAFEVRF
jgi:alpha-glucosidase (family GH31 glycosyl hydrolase)